MTTIVRAFVAACTVSLVAGCASVDKAKYLDYGDDVVKRTEDMRQGPANAPKATATSFDRALRCMDGQFVEYGIKGLSVLVEDIPDPTKKVNAGGKDMLISAVSQMSRRSRAIRLMAFSSTDFTLKEIIERGAQKLDEIPTFTIRGSVSQFDESVVKKQGDAGINLGPLTSGVAGQGTASVLGLDLNMINTATLTLVPGVVSKNSVLVMRSGEGVDGELVFKKFGANFNYTLAKSEGNAGALRTLTELAAIELFGKLAKVPYWSCLGIQDTDPAVQSEITDWWETLAGDTVMLVVYFQVQMKARGLYTGEINGRVDDALIESIQIYQKAMGVSPTTSLDYEFFKRYLSTNHLETQKRAQALRKEVIAKPSDIVASKVPETQAEAPAPVPGQLPNVVVLSPKGSEYIHRRGESYQIYVAVDRDANLYCYLVDENRRVNQFFPNPVQQSPAVRAGTRFTFPGNLPFKFTANLKGAVETVSCFASASPMGRDPLASVSVVRDPDELTAAFRRVAGPRIATGRFDVKVQ